MIPTTLARQLRRGLEDHLQAMFPVATPAFRDALPALLGDEPAWFRGPYLTLALPFREGDRPASDFFRHVTFGRQPYMHQQQAFARLLDQEPRSTIVATGTGSGKTECFMLPILEHVVRLREEGIQGVKAVLVYPMNALATDQARRLARQIHDDDGLRGCVTAGLYVGDAPESASMAMTEADIITDRETLRQHPPDILLTNYKMLDLLLLRPRDARLWRHNLPGTLRFLVVDELHTFDGAQGTDLACLVRRMEARLGHPERPLCVIGTSATLGQDAGAAALAAHAGRLFGQEIPPDAILGETRIDLETFLDLDGPRPDTPGEVPVPDPLAVMRLVDDPALAPLELARRLVPLYFPDWTPADDGPVVSGDALRDASGDTARDLARELSRRLRPHPWLAALLRVLGGRTLPTDEVLAGLGSRLGAFAPDAPGAVATGLARADREALLLGFVALVAVARVPQADPALRDAPMLQLVRAQVWLREWRQIVASVGHKPVLRFASDLSDEERARHLPVVHCRDCGATGWTGRRTTPHAPQVLAQLDEIYRAYFEHGDSLVLCYPGLQPKDAGPRDGREHRFCPRCLVLHEPAAESCPECPPAADGEEGSLVHVWVPFMEPRTDRGDPPCGQCGQRGGVTLMGARAATLTSVVIDQLFVGRANDDKKLLTFSDSVQDAAHRASFFSARTHGIVRRAAIARALKAHRDAPTLAELPERVFRTLAGEVGQVEALWRLVPPDMQDQPEFRRMAATGRIDPGSPVERRLLERLGWELVREFGLRVRVGRSLEKVGVAVAHVPARILNEATRLVQERITGAGGAMADLSGSEIRLFLRGWFRLLLERGAVLTPVTRSYLNQGGKTFLSYAHGFNMVRSDQPQFPGMVTAGQHLVRLVGAVGRPNRLERWVYRAWDVDQRPMMASAIHDLLPDIARLLVREGVLGKQDTLQGEAWGLPAEHVVVSHEVSRLVCSACRLPLHVPAHDEEHWEDAPCLRDACTGSYRVEAGRPFSALRRFYELGDVTPVVAREHTGLLSRARREDLEKAFKKDRDRSARDPNVLSCTPTFEMGLDIGDLSSVVLCQVPPAQANYLQRVGRAGRRDGNALVVSIATSRAHDLYFYADPLEMIAGEVRPPAIFLEAARVLERQLAAFAMDRWVATGVPEDVVPKIVRDLLQARSRKKASAFPQAFMSYLEANGQQIAEDFIALFPDLPDEVQGVLRLFLSRQEAGSEGTGGGLPWRLALACDEMDNQIKRHKSRLTEIERRIDELERHPARPQDYDDRIKELVREKMTVQALVKDDECRTTYGFLTDEGLLPNYAFPEEGIRLRSIIWRRKADVVAGADGSPGRPQEPLEYQRPAAAALSELAPQATFYAEGRKVRIDQVDLGGSEPERWRFCPDCTHAAIDDSGHSAHCPRCGRPGWADTGQVREMIRLRQVYASTPEDRSRSDDRSDDRETTFFERRFLIEVPPAEVQCAHVLNGDAGGGGTFGVEFVRRATFQDVNTGERRGEGTTWKMASQTVTGAGFTVCLSCGKVRLGAKSEHGLTCRYRGTGEGFDRVLFLYRRFHSEAVRLLLPLGDLEDDRRVQSFIAAFQLGLRLHFGGGIDHLRADLMTQSLPDGVGTLRYLVLYDTVPGGTGYLKQLGTDPDHLLRVLERAREHLAACACRLDETRDGCYRCLFAHRVARRLDRLSRREALAFLARLLSGQPTWTRVDTLADVDLGGIIGSVLERRFRDHLGKAPGVTMVSHILPDNSAGWRVLVDDKAWRMKPQHDVPDARGGTLTRPDFVLWPEDVPLNRPGLAIYLDGLAYHRDRLADDLRKREALRASGWRVWTLTHDDLLPDDGVLAAGVTASRLAAFLAPETLTPGLDMAELLGRLEVGLAPAAFRSLFSEGAFAGLLGMLRRPEWLFGEGSRQWTRAVRALAMTAGAHGKSEDVPKLLVWARPWNSGDAAAVLSAGDGTRGIIAANAGQGWGLHAALRFVLGAGSGEDASVVVLEAREHQRQDLAFRYAWLGFWRTWNRLQVLTHFAGVIETGEREDAAGTAAAGTPSPGACGPTGAGSPDDDGPAADGLPPAWQAVAEDLGPGHEELLRPLAVLGLPFPEVGVDLSAGGRVLGQAELAWPDRKVAACLPGQRGALESLVAEGWTLLVYPDDLTDTSRLQGALAP